MSLAHAKIDIVKPLERPSPDNARKRRRRIEPAVLISALAVIVLVSALLHVGQRARVAALSYDMHQAVAQLDRLKREQTQLLVEVERARSLERVEADARVRLGMSRPEREGLVVIAPTRNDTDVAVARVDSANASWFSALSQWYDRVSTQVRAALPRPAWTRESR